MSGMVRREWLRAMPEAAFIGLRDETGRRCSAQDPPAHRKFGQKRVVGLPGAEATGCGRARGIPICGLGRRRCL